MLSEQRMDKFLGEIAEVSLKQEQEEPEEHAGVWVAGHGRNGDNENI